MFEKTAILAAVTTLATRAAHACAPCREAVEAGVYDQHFGANLLLLLAPFATLLLIVTAIHFSDDLRKVRRYKGGRP